jgi:quinol monooxygenase YgiN
VSSRRLYIYFRVKRDSVADVVAAVRELQTALQAAMPGLRGELMRRIDEGDHVTLMETYAGAHGVTAEWQERIERDAAVRLGRWLIGPRHVEVFEPCA